MPFINGRFYINPAFGRGLERARAAEAEREPPSNQLEREQQDQDGHWVTIDGRHVLIHETQADRGQPPKKNCPQVPPHPPDANVDDNIRLVQAKLAEAKAADAGPHFPEHVGSAQHGVQLWFVNKVRPHGDWDYKRQKPVGKYDAFGNFNYGATGAVLWDEDTLLRGAGALKALETGGKFGYPWQGPDYGNQPEKNDQIRQGIDYYKNHCGDF